MGGLVPEAMLFTAVMLPVLDPKTEAQKDYTGAVSPRVCVIPALPFSAARPGPVNLTVGPDSPVVGATCGLAGEAVSAVPAPARASTC